MAMAKTPSSPLTSPTTSYLQPQLQGRKIGGEHTQLGHDQYFGISSNEQNYKAAYGLYKKAVLEDKKDVVAMVYLGKMLREGKGVDKDVTKAMRWFDKAGNLGSMEGLYQHGLSLVRR